MRKLGWNNAATLMDRWFAGGANPNPRQGPIDVDTLKMASWALTFPRAKTEYDGITTEKIWTTDRARAQLTQQLRNQGMLGQRKRPFGDLTLPAPKLERDYITYGTVGAGVMNHLKDPLDDMFGALGAFSFRVAVAGEIDPIPLPKNPPVRFAAPPEWRITVNQVGVYIWDSYDFNGDQTLGFWNMEKGEVSKVPGLDSSEVTNKSFRDWRQQSSKGCDFIVFSDVLVQSLSPPDSYVTR